MSHSWPTASRRISASSLCSLSEDNYVMEKETGETTEQTKSLESESMTSGDDRTEPDSETEKDDELKDEAVEKQTRSLLSRLEDFKQSYNRTHGQVCEFFERARVVQKLGLLESSQASKLLSLSGDEADDDDDCNSIADCNYADGQKTTGMKRKLRKWRKVMRNALSEICPRLGLENQPDINPGLMKHIVDEVRNLKSQLAFQHSNIMQLAQKTELYLQDSQQKEQFIADLLQNCKGIRFDNGGMGDAPVEDTINESASLETEHPPLPASLDDIQFGRSKELLSILSLTPEAGNVPNAESFVVHPQNFTGTQRTRGALIHRDSALDTNLTQLHGLEESQQGNSVRRGGSTQIASQDPRNVASSSSRTIHSSQPATRQSGIIPTTSCCNTGTGAAASSSSAVCQNSSSSGGLVSSKKRNLFMSVGGTLTMAVIGALAIGTTQRKLCNNPEVVS